MATVWGYRTVQQHKLAIQELDTGKYLEQIEHYGKSEGIPDEVRSNQLVPLRPHPPHHRHNFCRGELVASIHMSLCHSHSITPENEIFRQFMTDRLAEADQDSHVPSFDCLHTYAFEGTGSLSGSLSSLDSSNTDHYFNQTNDPGPGLLRLSRWQCASDYQTSFWPEKKLGETLNTVTEIQWINSAKWNLWLLIPVNSNHVSVGHIYTYTEINIITFC